MRASLGWADGVALDGRGNIYISGLAAVRKINPSGIISTFAGTPGGKAGFSGDGGPATRRAPAPAEWWLAADAAGNVYIADTLNHRVRKVDPAGIITTIALQDRQRERLPRGFGDGGFNRRHCCRRTRWSAGRPRICRWKADRVRKITPRGIISTFAGRTKATGPFGDGGPATKARLAAEGATNAEQRLGETHLQVTQDRPQGDNRDDRRQQRDVRSR